MPDFWLVTYQQAAIQVVSGRRVSAKSVPAVSELSARQPAQRSLARLKRQLRVSPHLEQRKPAGQRRRSR